MPPLRALAAWLLLATFLPGARAQNAPAPLPSGQMIAHVPCAADPAQSYALYLPLRYSPEKSWPIIYVFDPGARGVLPIQLYKDAAEKYGYILAASNTSRNFQSQGTSQAVRALWDDTHLRLRLDPRRTYTMGFSGGARVATSLVLRCAPCAIAGVIAHGAGYPASAAPSEKDPFAYLAFVGDTDFNWPELMELRRRKEDSGAPFRLIVFPGGHQWAPPAVFADGLSWLQLRAMASGALPRDPSFIDQLFARTQKEADDAARRRDPLAHFAAFRSLSSDFSGLRDVNPYPAKLEALRNSAEYKQALKDEHRAAEQQLAATQELSSKLSQLGEGGLEAQMALRSEIFDGMRALQSKAEHAPNDGQRRVLTRAFDALWAQGIEAGQMELEVRKNFSKAELYFRLMSSISPEQPWPVLLLAETNALRGDKKRALEDLREAIRRGLKRAESLEEDENLQTLQSHPEFRQLVGELKARSESPQTR